MRGDFEILGYNMILWLCGSLLWEKDVSDPVAVQKQKEKAFENIPEFLNKCFNGSVPKTILEYMTLVASMKFNDTPNYEKFRKIITDGLKRLSHKPDGKLEFKMDVSSQKQTLKSTPQKIKKTVDVKRSPRVLARKSLSPAKGLDDSTIGVIMDKKRGGVRDIKQILNNIESDEEYDIKIVKKKKKTDNSINKSKDENTSMKSRRRIKRNHIDSASDSEPEITVVSKGTRSRPNPQKRTPTSTKGSSQKLLVNESENSEDDMFDM